MHEIALLAEAGLLTSDAAPTWGFLTAIVGVIAALGGAAYARGKAEGHSTAAAASTAGELAALQDQVDTIQREAAELVQRTDGEIREELSKMSRQLIAVSDRVEAIEREAELEAARKEGAERAMAASESHATMRRTKPYRSGK